MASTSKEDGPRNNAAPMETGDGTVDVRNLEAQFTFLTEHDTCSVCSGFYGSCFGEPVCATCHAFLYPEDLGQAEGIAFWDSFKKDDGDSGNDEPSDPYLFGPERRPSEGGNAGYPPNDMYPDSPEEEQPPRAKDRLGEQLQLLSMPREPDPERWLIDKLPPEVLLAVFSYLDDLSLCSASNVCTQWRRLLEGHSNNNHRWRRHTMQRWPLFKPMQIVKSWWHVYRQLIRSAPCFLCVQQMMQLPQPSGEENTWRRHRLHSEIKSMRLDPLEGILAVPLDKACCHWQASIIGPQGSPYAGGIFYLYLQVPFSYPMVPPVVRFVTRIFHPNVSRHGDIGIDLFHHNWSLAMTIAKVLISVQSLLTDPFCEVCMEPAVGQLYLENKECFDLMARTWTWRYAMHDSIPPIEPLDI